jgi:DNA-binding NarL/FixJ family response regulator
VAVRVLAVDDHEILWAGMRAMLERLVRQLDPPGTLDFVACRDVAQAKALRGSAFDLVLLDYHLPDVSGPAALREIRATFEGAPVVVVSGESDPRRIREVIEQNAAGFIPKTTSEREMQAALQLVLACGVYLPPIALMEAQPESAVPDDTLLPEHLEEFLKVELSQRQRQVLSLALRGTPNKLIARKLGIAEGTVKVHLAMVYRALGVRNRTEAMYRVLSADAVQAIERL